MLTCYELCSTLRVLRWQRFPASNSIHSVGKVRSRFSSWGVPLPYLHYSTDILSIWAEAAKALCFLPSVNAWVSAPKGNIYENQGAEKESCR